MNNVVVNRMSKSIIHILNTKIQNFIPVISVRETKKYRIFYEQKIYAVHKLLIKINKDTDISNNYVDINVNIYDRLSIKFNSNSLQLMLRPDETINKTIAMRIAKTKYQDLPPKYVNFVQLFEKQTWVGAETRFIPEIQECGMIVKEPQLCYKIVSTQKANTHWMKTLIVVKPSQQQMKIGKLSILTSRMNYYEKDLYA